MIYLNSFLFCGGICLLGQIIMDHTKLTAGHITTLFVILGAFLDTFGLYDKILLWAGGGASVPITSFGHSLVHGALTKAQNDGLLGLFLGMFDLTSAGIVAAIIISFFLSLIFKPRD